MIEPAITINGHRLTQAQSLAVRVAVGLTAAYKARSREVLEIMSKTQPDPVDPPTRLRKAKPTVATHV